MAVRASHTDSQKFVPFYMPYFPRTYCHNIVDFYIQEFVLYGLATGTQDSRLGCSRCASAKIEDSYDSSLIDEAVKQKAAKFEHIRCAICNGLAPFAQAILVKFK